MINISRNPLWGRIQESYGEDPYLTARLTESYVKQMQGRGVLATLKHYLLNEQEVNALLHCLASFLSPEGNAIAPLIESKFETVRRTPGIVLHHGRAKNHYRRCSKFSSLPVANFLPIRIAPHRTSGGAKRRRA